MNPLGADTPRGLVTPSIPVDSRKDHAMSIVAEYDWESETMTTHPARQAFRDAVAQVADKARAKLPACAGRIASAVKLVLAGDVELLAAGGARVASRSDAGTTYLAVNGHCECKDYPRAPGNLCAHRLAYGIARRATELVPVSAPVAVDVDVSAEPVMLPAAPTAALPEAPASVNCHILLEGRQVQVTLRDTDETRLLQRLAALLKQYPAPQPKAPAASQPTQGQDQSWCRKHGVAMKQTTKEGRSWWSHRTDQGWCKGR
jgi:hypothetical protein